MKFPAAPAHTLIPLIVLSINPLSPASAQSTAEARPEVPATSVPDGYRWDSFLVRPEAGISLVYDSNIFATRSDEIDDTLILLTPSVDVTSQWERHKLNFNAGVAAARYRGADSENYDDYWADIDGRYDLSNRTNVFGGLGYSREHEDRSSPDDVAGSEPTTYDSSRAHAGLAHSWGNISARLGGTFETLDYQDVTPINNDDRDRDLTGLGLRLNYRINPRYVVFGQAVHDVRSYDQTPDDNGFDRDSDGNRFGAGFTGIFSNRLSGGGHIGHLSQSYDESTFSDVSTLDFNGQLTFRATPKTNLSATLERTLEETTLSNVSGYLYTVGTIEATHRIGARLRATAAVSVGEEDYQGIDREDDLYTAEVGLRYMLSPTVYIAASYRHLTRDSSQRATVLNDANIQELDDYSRQRMFLTLGTLLYPVRDTGALTAASLDRLPLAPVDWRGFFLGGQLAHGSTAIHGSGLRDQNLDQGEYANEGNGAGLFGGYGLSFDRWYVGIEAEADGASTDLYHRKDKGESRTLNVERGDSYGVSLRGGYRVAGGELLYLRLGRARTDFDTYYTVNEAPQNAADQTYTQDGTRYGVGTDIPAGKNVFIRMDYSHTDYDEFTTDLVTAAEEMTAADSYFRLGLGWQFGGNEPAAAAAPAPDIRGFYTGALIGHGSIQSHATGTHIDGGGSGGGPFDFNGDFGHNAGVTGGAFAGWGTTWQRWYGGLEATAESSTADWTHVKAPEGRNFSVEKKDTYGLGLRGGYQLPSGTLLYARADRVRTRFNTTWVKGGNRNNDVDRDDRMHGTRYGVGADIPATRSLFVRLDYSHTDYDDYGFTTEHSNADTMNFDNSGSLFRLGLGARF